MELDEHDFIAIRTASDLALDCDIFEDADWYLRLAVVQKQLIDREKRILGNNMAIVHAALLATSWIADGSRKATFEQFQKAKSVEKYCLDLIDRLEHQLGFTH